MYINTKYPKKIAMRLITNSNHFFGFRLVSYFTLKMETNRRSVTAAWTAMKKIGIMKNP